MTQRGDSVGAGARISIASEPAHRRGDAHVNAATVGRDAPAPDPTSRRSVRTDGGSGTHGTIAPDGAATTSSTPTSSRRAALVESLPEASDDTPLMAQLKQDARRRIELRGRRFPRPPSTRI